MTVLDFIIAIPLAFFIYKGWRRGIIFELTALVSIILGCYAAIHFSQWVAEAMELKGESSALIAFIITFVGVLVAAHFLGKVIEGFVKIVKLEFGNKLLGALLGASKCLVVLSVLLNFVLILDHEHKLITPDTQEKSILYNPAYKIGNKLTAHLKVYVQEKRSEFEKSHQS